MRTELDGRDVSLKALLQGTETLWNDPVEQVCLLRQSGVRRSGAQPTDTECGLERQRLRISAVVGASEVYAHIGDESIATVEEIKIHLAEFVRINPMRLAAPPKPGHFVVLCDADTPCRCRVMEVDGEQVTLFAVDLGFTRRVHFSALCWMKPGLLPKTPHKQAVRCKLAGFSNPVIEPKDVGLCLSTLVSISYVESFRRLFEGDETLQVLLGLTRCPLGGIVRHTMRVLHNLLHNFDLFTKLCSWNYLTVLVENLQAQQMYKNHKRAREVVLVVLETLSKLLFRNPGLENKFNELSGHQQLWSLVVGKTSDEDIYHAVCQVARNCIGESNLQPVMEYERNTRWQALAHLSPLERGFSVLLPPSQRLSNTPAPPHHSRSDRNNCDSSMRPRSRSCVRASAPEMKRSQSAQRTRSLSRTRSSSQHSPESEGVMSALRAADLHDSSSDDEDEESSIFMAHATNRKFTHGERIELDPVNCEYMQEKYVSFIEGIHFIPTIVGFLNAGIEGRIYGGIVNGRVFGLRLDRDQSDRLRLGIDRVMRVNIEPKLFQHQYDIRFFPVEGTKGLVVFEVTVRPEAGRPLTSFPKVVQGRSERQYVIRNRETGQTEPLTAQMVHIRAIEEAEAKYEAEIEELEAQLERRKAARES